MNNVTTLQPEPALACKRAVVAFNGRVMDDHTISYGHIQNLVQWTSLCDVINPRFQVKNGEKIDSADVYEDVLFSETQEWLMFILPKTLMKDVFFIGQYKPSDDIDLVSLTALSSRKFYERTKLSKTDHSCLYAKENDRHTVLIPCPPLTLTSKFRLVIGGDRTPSTIQVQEFDAGLIQQSKHGLRLV